MDPGQYDAQLVHKACKGMVRFPFDSSLEPWLFVDCCTPYNHYRGQMKVSCCAIRLQFLSESDQISSKILIASYFTQIC